MFSIQVFLVKPYRCLLLVSSVNLLSEVFDFVQVTQRFQKRFLLNMNTCVTFAVSKLLQRFRFLTSVLTLSEFPSSPLNDVMRLRYPGPSSAAAELCIACSAWSFWPARPRSTVGATSFIFPSRTGGDRGQGHASSPAREGTSCSPGAGFVESSARWRIWGVGAGSGFRVLLTFRKSALRIGGGRLAAAVVVFAIACSLAGCEFGSVAGLTLSPGSFDHRV